MPPSKSLLHTCTCMHAESGSSMLHVLLYGIPERSSNNRLHSLVLDSIFFPYLISSGLLQFFASVWHGYCDLRKTEDVLAKMRPVMSKRAGRWETVN